MQGQQFISCIRLLLVLFHNYRTSHRPSWTRVLLLLSMSASWVGFLGRWTRGSATSFVVHGRVALAFVVVPGFAGCCILVVSIDCERWEHVRAVSVNVEVDDEEIHGSQARKLGGDGVGFGSWTSSLRHSVSGEEISIQKIAGLDMNSIQDLRHETRDESLDQKIFSPHSNKVATTLYRLLRTPCLHLTFAPHLFSSLASPTL